MEIKIEALDDSGKWFNVLGHGCRTVEQAKRYMGLSPSGLRYTVDGKTYGPVEKPSNEHAKLKSDLVDLSPKARAEALKIFKDVMKKYQP